MEFDARRAAEAAVHAALAEAFIRPTQTRSRRARKRRLRPLRLLLRLIRLALMGVGLATTLRVLRDPELRHDALESLGQRIPIEGLLEEIAVEVEAVRAALAEQAAEQSTEQDAEPAKKATTERPRRSTSRTRGDTNGQRNRKPPSRGTRAA